MYTRGKNHLPTDSKHTKEYNLPERRNLTVVRFLGCISTSCNITMVNQYPTQTQTKPSILRHNMSTAIISEVLSIQFSRLNLTLVNLIQITNSTRCVNNRLFKIKVHS